MENVHGPDPVIQGHVHVLSQCVDTAGNGFNQSLSGGDAFFQHVASGGVKERLLIREVAIERSDANTGACGDGVSRWLAANFQHQLDSDIDQSLSVLSRISTHGASAACPLPMPLTSP
jgi:hypothetical protein